MNCLICLIEQAQSVLHRQLIYVSKMMELRPLPTEVMFTGIKSTVNRAIDRIRSECREQNPVFGEITERLSSRPNAAEFFAARLNQFLRHRFTSLYSRQHLESYCKIALNLVFNAKEVDHFVAAPDTSIIPQLVQYSCRRTNLELI